MQDTWVELREEAINFNYEQFSKLLKPSGAILAPVLKSNAYGHGLEQIYKILKKFTPTWICLNYLEEARKIRSLGYEGRILIVGPLFSKKSLEDAASLRLDVHLIGVDQLKIWNQLTDKPRAHLEIDTGLNRLGFHLDDLVELKSIKDKKNIIGIGMHFANVEDAEDEEFARQQLARFNQAIHVLETEGFKFEVKHTAASAPALLLPEARFDLCRLGISLYGLWSSDQTRLSYLAKFGGGFKLKPALSLKTKVAQVKQVKKNEKIGYGCTYKANSNMTIGVLPLGYFEGISRLVADGGSYVLIKGQRAPIVGRICMNMLMVDITHIAGVSSGDEVVMIGTSQDEQIAAEKPSGWSQTIHYEFLTRLHSGIPRIIV